MSGFPFAGLAVTARSHLRMGIFLAAALVGPAAANAQTPLSTGASVNKPRIDEAAANANVTLVKQFLVDVRAATFQHHDPKEIRAVSERYLRADYIQHSEGMKPGRDGYVDSMVQLASGKGLPAMPGPMPMPEDLYWVAQGDKVVWVSSVQLPGRPQPEFMFNMMRIQDGKIAEHWGK